MKKYYFIIIMLLTFSILSPNLTLAKTTNHEPWSKYPNNSEMKYQEVNSFYKALDKKQYCEFNHAKVNIRKKVLFQDVNAVLLNADKYGVGSTRTHGLGNHPKRQVYVFITIS